MEKEFNKFNKFVITEEMLDTKKWITEEKVAAFLEKIGFCVEEQISGDIFECEKYNFWKTEKYISESNKENLSCRMQINNSLGAIAA